MNRFLLAFALTFGAAGIASAQNVSTTTQNDTGNNAVVTQTGQNTSTIDQGVVGVGTGDNNRAIVQQKGASNTSDIDQTGTNNEGRVYQGAISGYPAGASTGSSATLVQSGNNNSDAGILGDGTLIAQGANGGSATGGVSATVTQAGNNSGVTVEQGTEGSAIGSDAFVTQSAGSDNNSAVAYQGVLGGSTSTNDTATINQSGTSSGNMAQIRQGFQGGISSNSDATITQNGLNGTATTTQAGDDNSATVTQNGTGDLASVNQDGAAHVANLVQTGGSMATIGQQSASLSPGNTANLQQDASRATISQTGNGNIVGGYSTTAAIQTNGSTLNVRQVSSPLPANPAYAGTGAGVEQRNGATATIDQTSNFGPGSGAALRQWGASTAFITQTAASAGHSANVQQYGDRNITRVTQEDVPLGAGSGGSNTIAVTYGTDNSATFSQTGTSHVAVSQVFGNFNALTVTQAGPASGQTLTSNVTGNNNTATVDQSSLVGGPLSDNTAALTVVGDQNTIGVTQMGEGNAATVNQTGSSNTATVTQN